MRLLHLGLLALVTLSCGVPDPLTHEEYEEHLKEPLPDVVLEDVGVPDVTGDAEDGGVSLPDDGEVPDVADTSDMGEPDAGCEPMGEGDWCDGIDNDCDGETDEDGGPPEQTVDLANAAGWLRTSPAGTVVHSGGPAAFAGYVDTDTIVWTRTISWRGDVNLGFNFVLAQMAPEAEIFMGAWSETALPAPSLRTGLLITRAEGANVLAQGLVEGEVVTEVEAELGSFLGALFRLSTSTGRVLIQLQKGDGSQVAESETTGVTAIPSYAGLAVAVSGGPLLGSVGRVTLGPGNDCLASAPPACDACEVTAPCQNALCNPLYGCDVQERYCPLEDACTLASECDPEIDGCTEVVQKANGAECDDGDGCTTGSTCNEGACEGGEPVVCDPPNQCQDEGTCNEFFAFCEYPAKPQGLACDDDDLCTIDDSCQDGQCVPASVEECPETGPCETESVCVPDIGECTVPEPLEDGAACDDGDGCTTEDVCTEGTCAGVAKECDDANPCTLDACVEGQCTFAPSDDCVVWETPLGGGPILGPPALGSDNAVYMVAGGVHALDTGGTLTWTSAEVSDVTSPTVSVNSGGGRVFAVDAPSSGTRLVALDTADGSIAWSLKVPGTCTLGEQNPCRSTAVPTVAGDGTVLLPTAGAGLLAITENGESPGEGKVLWTLEDYAGGTSSVVVGQTGALYVGQGGESPGLRSVTADGESRWLFPTDEPVKATPVVVEGIVLIATGVNLIAVSDLSDEPTEIWTRAVSNPIADRQPVLVSDGNVVVASNDTLWAFNPVACATEDQEECLAWTVASPALGNIGQGFAATAAGHIAYGTPNALQLLDIADGASFLAVPLSAKGPTAPLLLPEGLLIVGGTDGSARAIAFTEGVEPAATAWPVYNRQQSRNAVE